MVNIEKVCKSFLTDLDRYDTKEDLLSDCVYNKLNTLYLQQSEKYDSLLNAIDKMVDMDDISGVCTLLKKLSKNINCNRQQLILLLGRIE